MNQRSHSSIIPSIAALLVVKHVIGLLSIMVELASTPDMEPLIDEIVNQVMCRVNKTIRL